MVQILLIKIAYIMISQNNPIMFSKFNICNLIQFNQSRNWKEMSLYKNHKLLIPQIRHLMKLSIVNKKFLEIINKILISILLTQINKCRHNLVKMRKLQINSNCNSNMIKNNNNQINKKKINKCYYNNCCICNHSIKRYQKKNPNIVNTK